MENKLHDPQTLTKAEIWHPKTMEVKRLSANIKVFLNDLKNELKKDSTNANIVKKLFEDRRLADELQQKLTVYKKELIASIKPVARIPSQQL